MNTAKLAVEVKGTGVETVPNPQGQKANKNGQRLEDRVEAALRKLGVNFVQHRDYDPTTFNTERLCIKNVPHTTPYGGRGRHEFDMINVVPGRVRIECHGLALCT